MESIFDTSPRHVMDLPRPQCQPPVAWLVPPSAPRGTQVTPRLGPAVTALLAWLRVPGGQGRDADVPNNIRSPEHSFRHLVGALLNAPRSRCPRPCPSRIPRGGGGQAAGGQRRHSIWSRGSDPTGGGGGTGRCRLPVSGCIRDYLVEVSSRQASRCRMGEIAGGQHGGAYFYP